MAGGTIRAGSLWSDLGTKNDRVGFPSGPGVKNSALPGHWIVVFPHNVFCLCDSRAQPGALAPACALFLLPTGQSRAKASKRIN